MRLSLRFLIPLLVALGVFAYAAVPLVDTLMTRWFVRDLDVRSNLIAAAVQEPLEELISTGSSARVLGFFHRLTTDERLYAVGLCLDDQAAPLATAAFPGDLRCSGLAPYLAPGEHLLRTPRGVLHVAVGARRGARTPGGEREGRGRKS
jgi:trehalose 6-phosphate synthase